MGRLAVLVGINYFGTSSELHGCINDVYTMQTLLTERFGYDLHDIEVITDDVYSPLQPTGANIRGALRRMVNRSRQGDILFFHFSGHGTLINPGTPSEYEAIVPSDNNVITSYDFRSLVDQLPPIVKFHIVSDSCHSGGLIDKETEQIGPHVTLNDAYGRQHPNYRPRFIPYQQILGHVASLSGIESDDIGDHMMELFGDDRSIRYFANQYPPPINADDGILLSGCQSNEYSTEGHDSETGEACGVFTHSLKMVLKGYERRISNRDLVMRSRAFLERQGYMKQHPCLYCSNYDADMPFLWQPEYTE